MPSQLWSSCRRPLTTGLELRALATGVLLASSAVDSDCDASHPVACKGILLLGQSRGVVLGPQIVADVPY